jgi:hypothetical protein
MVGGMLGLRALALALILARLLPPSLPLAVVVLLAFFAFLALLPTLPVDGLTAACVRHPPESSGAGDLSIENATACRGEVWLAVPNPLARGALRVETRELGALICLL